MCFLSASEIDRSTSKDLVTLDISSIHFADRNLSIITAYLPAVIGHVKTTFGEHPKIRFCLVWNMALQFRYLSTLPGAWLHSEVIRNEAPSSILNRARWWVHLVTYYCRNKKIEIESSPHTNSYSYCRVFKQSVKCVPYLVGGVVQRCVSFKPVFRLVFYPGFFHIMEDCHARL